MITQSGSSYKFKVPSSSEKGGLRVTKSDWERKIPGYPDQGRTYILTYEIEWIDGTLTNIGCYPWDFAKHNTISNSGWFSITVTDRQGRQLARTTTTDLESRSRFVPKEGFKQHQRYYVTVKGTIEPNGTKSNPSFWI
jgi:hypothetical protein